MTEVISVKFKSRGKTYYFDPNGVEVPDGAQVVVETSKGLELADCVKGNHYVTDERIVPPLRPVVRIATPDDLRIAEICKAREKEAFGIAEQKIAQHGLDMKLVDVECNFEGSKMLFFFTSDGRVDFRELVKDLAGIFRTRIELRQIGVRDEAKMLGGLGICGRPFCCNQFLDDFQPVSTKMAKVQSLSLNPTKISGACGRLMCCLRYEQEAYEDLVKTVPKNGAFVETPSGYGSVAQVNLLRQKVKVHIDGDDSGLKSFDADEVAAVPGGRPKPGEPLPHVLKLKVKTPEPEEPEDDGWQAPSMFGELRGFEDSPARADTERPASSGGERRPARPAKPDAAEGEERRPAAQGDGEKKKRRRPRHKKPNGEHAESGESTQRRQEGRDGAQQPSAKQEKRPPRTDAEKPASAGPARPPKSDAADGGERRAETQGDGEKKKRRRPRHKKPNGEHAENGESTQRRQEGRDGAQQPSAKQEKRPPRQNQHQPKQDNAQHAGAADGAAGSGDGAKKPRNRYRRFRGPSKPL